MFEDTKCINEDEKKQQELIQELGIFRKETDSRNISVEQINEQLNLFTLQTV
jgi:hypothetical protein